MKYDFKKDILHLCSYYIGNKLYSYLFSSLSNRVDQQVYIPVKDSSLIGLNKVNHNKINFIYDDFLKPYHRIFYGLKINNQLNRLDGYFKKNSQSLINIDLIHAHTLFSDGGTAYLLFKKYSIPYVVNIRNTDINFFYKYAIHYRCFSHEILYNASRIIFISYSYKKLFCDKLPEKVLSKLRHKLMVIPNGVDSRFIDKNIDKIHDKNINLFTSASLDKNKNIISIIDLVIQLIKEGNHINYRVAGQGPLLIELKEYVEKKGFSNYIKFLGQVSSEELISHLDNSNIFIMVSFKETFGISYIEAMARGLPIIYTKNQGVDGFFYQGEVGYSVKPKDFYSMKIAISNIMENYPVISQRCRQQAAKFSWDFISDEYTKTYIDVIEGE